MAYSPHNFQSGTVLRANDLNEMDAQIMQNEITASRRDFLANAYSAASTYQQDDLVIYNGELYYALDDIPVAEAWNPHHWEPTNIGSYLRRIRYGLLDP